MRTTEMGSPNTISDGPAPNMYELEEFLGPLLDRLRQTAGTKPPSGLPQPPSSAQTPGQQLRSSLARLAEAEWSRWNGGRLKEKDPRMRPVLRRYWVSGVGWQPSRPRWWSTVPWSAAFISYVVRSAGAGRAFRYSGAHARYIVAAKQNRVNNATNPFKAYRVTEVAPRVGDIVCKSRAGSGATYATIRRGHKTHCDIVAEVHPTHLVTIGGNVKNSVSKTRVRIAPNGRIRHRGYFAVIRVGG